MLRLTNLKRTTLNKRMNTTKWNWPTNNKMLSWILK